MHRLSQSPTEAAFVQNPYPFYARARAAGPLVHWTDYGFPVATTHEAVNGILRDRRFGREPVVRPDVPDHLAPFYALDEVDAFLDAANADLVGELVDELAGDAQFVVVSHRSAMLERSERAIGVMMQGDNVSAVTGIDLSGEGVDDGDEEVPADD